MKWFKRCNLCNKIIFSDVYVCTKCHNEKIAGKLGITPTEMRKQIEEFERFNK
ncbi:MAG: hypothetical protein ACFFG0_04705 [Candidatus Thorarchaeota archaeon]